MEDHRKGMEGKTGNVAEKPASKGSLLNALFYAASFIVAIIAGTSLFYPLTDTDVWWHLSAGRWMDAQDQLPKTDPFCSSSVETPWIDVHWGFQKISWFFWGLGGSFALIALKTFCLLLAFFLPIILLFRSVWRSKTLAQKQNLTEQKEINQNNTSLSTLKIPAWAVWLSTFFAAWCLFSTRFLLDYRPLFITLLGLAAIALIIEKLWKECFYLNSWQKIVSPFCITSFIALLVIQWFLSNIQGLFFLGPAIVFAYAVAAFVNLLLFRQGNYVKHIVLLFFVFISMSVISMATPYGLEAWLLPWKLLLRLNPSESNIWSTDISENIPLLSLYQYNPQRVLPALWMIFISAFSLDLIKKSQDKSLITGRLFWLIGYAGLAIIAERNVPLLALAASFIFTKNLFAYSVFINRQINAKVSRQWLQPKFIAIFLLFPGMAWSIWSVYKIKNTHHYRADGEWETLFRYPKTALEWMSQHPVPMNLWTEMRYGGSVTFKLYPKTRCFVDGRMVLHDEQFYGEFLKSTDYPARFPAYARKWKLGSALIPIAESGRQIPLAAFLLNHPAWDLMYLDGAVALFFNKNSKNFIADSIADSNAHSGSSQILGKSPNYEVINQMIQNAHGGNLPLLQLAQENVAELFIQSSKSEWVLQWLPAGKSLSSDRSRAKALLELGQIKQGMELLHQIESKDANHFKTLKLLSEAYFAIGDVSKAKSYQKKYMQNKLIQ